MHIDLCACLICSGNYLNSVCPLPNSVHQFANKQCFRTMCCFIHRCVWPRTLVTQITYFPYFPCVYTFPMYIQHKHSQTLMNSLFICLYPSVIFFLLLGKSFLPVNYLVWLVAGLSLQSYKVWLMLWLFHLVSGFILIQICLKYPLF